MSFATRFGALRSAHDMTLEEVGRRLDPPKSAQAVWKWENEGVIPRSKALFQLADLFNVSVSDLLGDGDHVDPVASSALVPVLATAHMGHFEEEGECDFMAEVPASVVDAHPGSFLVHGFGPCMNRRFPEDALLLVDPSMEPRSGEAVLVEDEDHRALVRTYMRGSSTVMLSPDSWSEDIPDIIGTPDSPAVRLVGVVVWYQAARDVRHQ